MPKITIPTSQIDYLVYTLEAIEQWTKQGDSITLTIEDDESPTISVYKGTGTTKHCLVSLYLDHNARAIYMGKCELCGVDTQSANVNTIDQCVDCLTKQQEDYENTVEHEYKRVTR